MFPRKNFLIIYNPVAGWRRREKLALITLELLKRGAQVRLKETQASGHGTILAAEAARDGWADVIVAAGGDGTINEVANGLAGSDKMLGVIPMGTANVLAWEIGMPSRPSAIAMALLNSPVVETYAGLANGRRFMLMVGIGFDATVVRRVVPAMKRRFGKLAFVSAGLVAWLAHRRQKFVIEAEGETFGVEWAVIAKAQHYGGPFILAPGASIAAPTLDLVFCRKAGRWQILRCLAGLAAGRMDQVAGIERRSVTDVTVRGAEGSGRTVAVQMDGDAIGNLPLEIGLKPDPFCLITPDAAQRQQAPHREERDKPPLKVISG